MSGNRSPKGNSVNYARGDDLIMETPDRKRLGKLFKSEPGSGVVRYYDYLFRDEVPTSEHHGKKEIFKTDTLEKEYMSNIIRKAKIVKMRQYADMSFKSGGNIPEEVYLVRQKYDRTKNSFIPQLETNCFCKTILNPDDGIFPCPNGTCSEIFHVKCAKSGNRSRLSCPACGSQLPQLQPEKNTGKKRALQDQTNKGANNGTTKGDPKRLKLEKTINSTAAKASATSRYKNLQPEAAEHLEKQISLLTKETEVAFGAMDVKNGIKQRRITRDKIATALLYSMEEIRSIKSESNSADYNQIIGTKSERELRKNAQEKAIILEAQVFVYHGDSISREYLSKVRSILYNLNDSRNPDLRARVLRGEIDGISLCTASATELASNKVKEERSEKQEKHFTQQVFLNETQNPILVKSHKGEAIIERESEFPIGEQVSSAVETIKSPDNRSKDDTNEEEEEDSGNDDGFDPDANCASDSEGGVRSPRELAVTQHTHTVSSPYLSRRVSRPGMSRDIKDELRTAITATKKWTFKNVKKQISEKPGNYVKDTTAESIAKRQLELYEEQKQQYGFES